MLKTNFSLNGQKMFEKMAEVFAQMSKAMPAATYTISKNKQIFYQIITAFEESVDKKFHIINYKFQSGYFIFDRDEDSIMHFEIAEIPNYLFGAWLVEDENIGKLYIDVFCQHKLYIDKFKPSRGDFNIRIELGQKDKDIKYNSIYFGELENMLDFIKNHEALFFCCGDDITSYIPEYKAKWKMFRTIRETKLYEKNKRKTFKTICLTLKKLKNKGHIDYDYIPDFYNRKVNSDEWQPYINDTWIVLTLDKKGRKVIENLRELKKEHLSMGILKVYDGDYFEDREDYKDYIKFLQKKKNIS